MAEIAPGIEVDINICHGKPVIAGSRVPVRAVLGAVAGGDPIEQVAEDYGVTPDAIRRAIAFANDVLAQSGFVPTGGAR